MNEDPDDSTPAEPPRPPHGRIVGLAAVALIVAIAALVASGWSVWQLQHVTASAQATHKQDAASITALQQQLAARDKQQQARDHQLDAFASELEELRATTQGSSRRIANLESAYTTLSGQQQSGRDTRLLNDVEMLLRAGQQRYELFHDGAGATKAYTQAIDVLAQVQNPAYTSVRASAITERNALAAAAPPSRRAALDTLSTLRGKVASLPLASTPSAPQPSAKRGFWSRIAHSFSGIVKVTREHDGAQPLGDTRFARQTLALNLARAQESLLTFDEKDYRAALQRGDATLATQFDTGDSDVQAVRAQLADLLSQGPSGPAPQLGGALAQLKSLRAAHPVAPVSPSPATSTGTHP